MVDCSGGQRLDKALEVPGLSPVADEEGATNAENEHY